MQTKRPPLLSGSSAQIGLGRTWIGLPNGKLKAAKYKSCDSQAMMMCPSAADFKNAIKHNFTHGCPVTVKDIEIAEDVFVVMAL